MDVAIVGCGMTAVGEHWSRGIGDLAEEAGRSALEDAGLRQVDALFVGNAYGATFNQQTQLGSLVAHHLGLAGIEAYTCEAGDASGGAALRTGCLAVASGAVNTALVIGVEKTTDTVGPARVRSRGVSLDADFESVNGATLTAMAGMLMRRYMYDYDVTLDQFEGFSVNAHRNGAVNPRAMYRNQLRAGAFVRAPMIAEPVSLFDSAPDADGAAALVLAVADLAADLVPQPVAVCGSAVVTDSLALQDRQNPLQLGAVKLSTERALHQAGLTLSDIDLLELHDAYTILTTLTLESMGLGQPGGGWKWAADAGARIALDGDLPISTFGGLKSRGNPSGATGVYQAAEAALQLRGQAGQNQAQGVKRALTQSIGGLGATVVTHILSAIPE